MPVQDQNTIQFPAINEAKTMDAKLVNLKEHKLIIGFNKLLHPINIIHKNQSKNTLLAFLNTNLLQSSILRQMVVGTIHLQN
jgi:hypothetical protein